VNAEEIISAVKRMTYKPGYELSVYPSVSSFGGQIISFLMKSAELPDSNGSSEKTKISYVKEEPVRLFRSIEDLTRYMSEFVALFERHESEEWLRFDGKRVVNPHWRG